MTIFKKALGRRTFLRGMGATVALPLLDAMVPALTPVIKSAAAPVARLGFIYTPNGYIRDQWVPAGVGKDFEFTPSLAALEPFRDQLVIVSGLGQRQAFPLGDPPGTHSRCSGTWITCVHPKATEGADVRAGTSADQVAAAVLGKETVLPSLELATEQNEQMIGNCEAGYSCVYQNTFSWRTPTTPLPMEVHPRVVFERLFGDGSTPEARRAQLRTTGSILDSVTDHIADLQQTLGTSDRGRLTQYLDSVREIESRIQRAEARTDDPALELPDRPVDIPATFEEHTELMFDLQLLAYQADITRVIGFQMGRELSPRTYPQIGIPGGHHPISHHGFDPEKMAQKAKIDAHHISLLAAYAEKLRATPDGEGSLLDHIMVLYGAGLGEPNMHNPYDLPNLVLGGGRGRLKGGRHLAFPIMDYVPMANLLVSILDKADVPVEQHGDSTGKLEGLSGV